MGSCRQIHAFFADAAWRRAAHRAPFPLHIPDAVQFRPATHGVWFIIDKFI